MGIRWELMLNDENYLVNVGILKCVGFYSLLYSIALRAQFVLYLPLVMYMCTSHRRLT